MPGFGDYEGPGQVFYQGKLLADAKTVRISHQGNGSDVMTMHRGYAGEAPGAFKSEITIENAVPKGGMEADFTEAMITRKTVRVVVVRGGQRLGYEGKISTEESENSIENAASHSFTVSAGKPKKI